MLEGNIALPEGVTVLETTPVKVTEFVQVAADGETAADCSSGTCECLDGYKDYGVGVGCEPIPVWQEWGEWSECPVSCAGGTRRRGRICGDGTRNGIIRLLLHILFTNSTNLSIN